MSKHVMSPVLARTLYLNEGGAYVRLENEQIAIERDGALVRRIPMHMLSAMVLHERTMVTPSLMRACGEHNVQMSWFAHSGAFAGSLRGPTTGNVLLRMAQYRTHDDESRRLELARAIVRGKVENSRRVLQRRARDAEGDAQHALRQIRAQIGGLLSGVGRARTSGELFGHEGGIGRTYFSAFPHMIRQPGFEFSSRTKRPPRDPLNSLLSFLYTLATSMCVSACDGVGLDPQVGFLHHELRPGRPSCALDLVEEFRAALVDRLALSLINRRQIHTDSHFERRMGGAVYLNDVGREVVFKAWHARCADMVPHPAYTHAVTFGLIPHIQARLLARHLRGDMETYEPFVHQ